MLGEEVLPLENKGIEEIHLEELLSEQIMLFAKKTPTAEASLTSCILFSIIFMFMSLLQLPDTMITWDMRTGTTS